VHHDVGGTGALAQLQKVTVRFVRSRSRRVTTRISVDGFPWNYIFEGFTQICREISRFLVIIVTVVAIDNS
jgi:hypothetical protein